MGFTFAMSAKKASPKQSQLRHFIGGQHGLFQFASYAPGPPSIFKGRIDKTRPFTHY